jgi:tellurite resistance protein TerC
VDVPTWVWLATIVALLLVLAFDLFVVDLHPHQITVGEAARWVVFYVAAAVAFGLGLFLLVSGRYAGEFFAGYITEYSLSVDNLFVFVIIMSTFAVPAIYQHKVLLFGILCALVLRGAFIAAGAAVIAKFHWVFYLFGAFLLYTAWNLAFPRGDEGDDYRENRAIRLARRLLPVTEDYHGSRALIRVGGRLWVTPLLVVMIAIGTTDLLFALDSIPAIFGLTKEPYLVFTANAFALMGLRQLFFLLGGLLNRLVYLDKGLSVILGFIGVKLLFEALAGSGAHWAPHIGVVQSLVVIVSVLAVTTLASLLKVRADPSAAKPRAGGAAAPTAAARADPAGADASRADASRADASRADASRADASRADASRADASRADASRADASRADASRAGTALPGGGPAGPGSPGTTNPPGTGQDAA